jgi:glycosyltransferase involved in cell wall biosynthesis
LGQRRDGPNESSPGLHLIYFAPADIQVARVDRNCIVKFCEAMADRGGPVTLVSMRISVLPTEPSATRAIWDIYGVRRGFELISVRIPVGQKGLDKLVGQVVLRTARAVTYPLIGLRLLFRSQRASEVVVFYTKNYGLVPGLLLARCLRPKETRIIFEVHVPPHSRLQRMVLARADGVVCNGRAVRDVLLERRAVQSSSAISLHQGFSPEAYPPGNRADLQKAARLRLGWNPAEKVVVYTGKMYWRYAEIDLLLRTTLQLVPAGIRMVIVGGRADHAQRWRDEAARQGIGNVFFRGFVPPSEVTDYQVAADVLVSYYPSDIATRDYLSPGKLFEYMASGTPIVAADYSPLREVLRAEENAILVEPERPALLAEAICRVMDNPALGARLGTKARHDVSRFTWAARAETISTFASRLERS